VAGEEADRYRAARSSLAITLSSPPPPPPPPPPPSSLSPAPPDAAPSFPATLSARPRDKYAGCYQAAIDTHPPLEQPYITARSWICIYASRIIPQLSITSSRLFAGNNGSLLARCSLVPLFLLLSLSLSLSLLLARDRPSRLSRDRSPIATLIRGSHEMSHIDTDTRRRRRLVDVSCLHKLKKESEKRERSRAISHPWLPSPHLDDV